MSEAKYTIGFSNLDERNPFTVNVRQHLEAVAADEPDIELIVRNNDMDTPTAIANSEYFAEISVDVAIVFHIDERAGQEVAQPLLLAGIPTIAIDIPIDRTIYFGINNEETGTLAGGILADWINEHWDGQLDKTLVLIEHRVLEIFRQRFISAVKQLEENVPGYSRDNTLYLDNGGEAEITAERVKQVISNWQEHRRIAIIAMNDKIAQGALTVIREQGRQDDFAILSYDGTQVAIDEFKREDSPLVVSPSLRPKVYATRLIDLARRMAQGERVPGKNYVDTVPITQDNYHEYDESEG